MPHFTNSILVTLDKSKKTLWTVFTVKHLWKTIPLTTGKHLYMKTVDNQTEHTVNMLKYSMKQNK